MANQPGTNNRRGHPLRILADRLIDRMGVRDAVDGAIKAANESGLPQGVGGPADAYRHLLIAGELRRRLGPLIGASLMSAYEFLNDREGQSRLNRRMDDINNAVARNGPDLATFEDLQRWARGKITEAAPFNGDGLEGRVMWHRKPARGWRPDWSKVPLLSIERGGAEHHSGLEFGSGIPSGVAATDPFDRLLAAWSEEDITAIMRSKAYLQPDHPDHRPGSVPGSCGSTQTAGRSPTLWRHASAAARATQVRRSRRPRPRTHARGGQGAGARAYALPAGLSGT